MYVVTKLSHSVTSCASTCRAPVLIREGYVSIQFIELPSELKMNCLEELTNNRVNRNSCSEASTFESRTELSPLCLSSSELVIQQATTVY
jgi:hypothetical protein